MTNPMRIIWLSTTLSPQLPPPSAPRVPRKCSRFYLTNNSFFAERRLWPNYWQWRVNKESTAIRTESQRQSRQCRRAEGLSISTGAPGHSTEHNAPGARAPTSHCRQIDCIVKDLRDFANFPTSQMLRVIWVMRSWLYFTYNNDCFQVLVSFATNKTKRISWISKMLMQYKNINESYNNK